MILYSVDNTIGGGFNRQVVIDEFISAIWTERFIEAGDFELVMPAAHKNLKLLAPGNLMGCQGSRELMLIESRSIEEGLVKATGNTVEKFFNERILYQETEITTNIANRVVADSNPEPASSSIVMVGFPDALMKGVVNYMQNMHFLSTPWSPRIPGLRVANPDPSPPFGAPSTEDIPDGPVYDTLLSLAKKYNIGQTVTWQKIEGGDHELVYDTIIGRDLTGASDNAVRFSPKMDNFANVKQLLSDADSKNIFFEKAPQWLNPGNPNAAYAAMWSVDQTSNEVFHGRFMLIDSSDISEDKFEGTDVAKAEKVYRIMQDRLWKAFNEKKRIKIVDGEVTPETQFEYKKDYFLGDIVEIEGDFGEPIKGMISEYIRSSDETGQRSYPTVVAPPDPLTGPGG